MGGRCGKQKKTGNSVGILENTETPEESEEKLFLAGTTDAIRDDKLTEVKITEDKSVLVGKYDKEYFAVGSKCPHAGAPLVNGVLIQGKIRCPWHAACFDLKTGDLEDFPGFDCIPSYPVQTQGSNLYVKVNPKTMGQRRLKAMAKMKDKTKTVVIIGTGPSGYSCAQTLREEGFDGRVVMVTADSSGPYDRTKLTKKFGCTFDDIKLRSETYFEENSLEVLLNATVHKVNTEESLISFENDVYPELGYDWLFVATGMSPRYPYSKTYKNVHTLHALRDHLEIVEKSRDKSVLLIGSSFIAMELAEILSPVASSVQILSRSSVPYVAAFGEPTGEALLNHFLSKLPNVTFHKNTVVSEFLENDGRIVHSIGLDDGRILTCDLVVVAVGGIAATTFLQSSEIDLAPKSGVIQVNEFLETNCRNVFAGGDIVAFPCTMSSEDSKVTVGHWQVASRHGRIAALNIIGRNESVKEYVPFFWTNVCGLPVRFVGLGEGYDETRYFGDVKKNRFCVVFLKQNRLMGVCCVGSDTLAAELSLVFQNKVEWTNQIPDAIIEKFKE